MRRFVPSLLLVALFLVAAAAPSRAAFRFGESEQIVFLEDVLVKGAANEPLYLGRLIKTVNVFLPVYVVDEGYVLGVTGQSGRYYPMPKDAELASFQSRGLLPDPLPPYQLGWLDYLLGYALWWTLLLILGSWAFSTWLGRNQRAQQPAAAEPPIQPSPTSARDHEPLRGA